MENFFKNQDCDASFDDIADAAREFGRHMGRMGRDFGREMGRMWREYGESPSSTACFHPTRDGSPERFADYFYPPMHAYNDDEGALVLEFALAGYDESGVSIVFQGDYLVLCAKAKAKTDRDERGGFGTRDITRQKYRVPADAYDQEKAKAIFKNGVLGVTIPAKDVESVRIEILKEGD
jgi:HSP20 family protein